MAYSTLMCTPRSWLWGSENLHCGDPPRPQTNVFGVPGDLPAINTPMTVWATPNHVVGPQKAMQRISQFWTKARTALLGHCAESLAYAWGHHARGHTLSFGTVCDTPGCRACGAHQQSQCAERTSPLVPPQRDLTVQPPLWANIAASGGDISSP